MDSKELRERFLRFFEERGHLVLPSSSLVPQGDPTLLLTSAGMVQIKPYFMGEAKPPRPRLASCQKCFRTTDIELVGDAWHLTFFEMLGNFSVGDYFKKEAIGWAWEFVTHWLGLPKERLWITVFLDDDEAVGYWRGVGVPEERILRRGEEDNFWGPAGETGPCGPCSEILYDLGEEFGCGRPTCGPDCDCGRFSEIWNLVFTQFYQDEQGQRMPLPRPNIDTGMGLERTLAVLQGKSSVYETDLFLPLLERLSKLTGRGYDDEASRRAMRVVVEHGRAVTFLIGDGVVPSNEGRGYLLRRVLRRAARFGRLLGLEEPFLSELAEVVIDLMGEVYPELGLSRGYILEVIALEERKFQQTLSTGLALLEEVLEELKGRGRKEVPGEEVFRLYDTYGFPLELTAEIARENGFSLDPTGFEHKMQEQRERARAAQKFGLGEKSPYAELGFEYSEFAGYEQLKVESKVVGLLAGGQRVEVASTGQEVEVILSRTPFYGEMGGQVGDKGEIRGRQGRMVVEDTQRPLPELMVHRGRVVEGELRVGDWVEAEVDAARRWDIAQNHTATHLLQAALRGVLGTHVRQAGSLVAPERLRFDFTHPLPLSSEELEEVQRQVNENIRRNLKVEASIVPYSRAIESGALALFGEKYGDRVRMVEIKAPDGGRVSAELCGGTHVKNTGEIGFFQVVSERGIGSGLRRIEAVTGRGAEAFLRERLSALEKAAVLLESSPEEVPEKLSGLISELGEVRRRAKDLELELLRRLAEDLLSQVERVDGVAVVAARASASNMELLRQMGDFLKEKLGSVVVVLAVIWDNRPRFLCMVTPDLVARGLHAGKLVKRIAQVTGGSGGGKAEIGQAGGRDRSKLDQALKIVPRLVKEALQS